MKDQFIAAVRQEFNHRNLDNLLFGHKGMGELFGDDEDGWFFMANESDCNVDEGLLVELDTIILKVCEKLDIEYVC